jgi:DNA-binding MurR/RpiR family transcriptional regulator
MPQASPSLQTRIHAAKSLSQGHRRIADRLLGRAGEAAFWGIEELAGEAQVSVSAVVRFAQKLGYSGFSELKADLVEAAKRQKPMADRLLDAPKGAAALMLDVARRDIANIEKTVHSIDERLLSEVLNRLAGAQNRVIIGHGISAVMAQHLAYLLTVTGLVTVAGNPAEFGRQVVNLGPRDVLVAISFPPYSVETVEVVGHARQRKIPVVAITDRLDSPVAAHATHVLPVPGENLLFSHSLAGFNVLIHTLATGIASRNPGEALKRLRDAERILKPILVED